MNNGHAKESVQAEKLQQGSHWFVALADDSPPRASSFECRLIAGEGRARKLYLSTEIGFAAPSWAERNGCAVIFSGILYDGEDFQRNVPHDVIGLALSDAENHFGSV